MAIRISPGANGGVPRRGLGVGVVVVAVREPGPVFHKEIEAAPLELIAISIQVIAAKLIDHHNHNELGLANIDLCRRRER